MPEPGHKRKTYGVHSNISYLLISVSAVILFYIGFTHINDPDEFSRNYSRLVIIEGVFAVTGLFFSDMFHLEKLDLYPKKETARPITIITMMVFVSGLLLSEAIQIGSRVTLTISETEIALGIIFSAPAEESFLRGFLLSFTSWLSDRFNVKRYVAFTHVDEKSGLKTTVGMSGFEFVGCFVSAIIFALMHVNYYGNDAMILSLFLMGLVFLYEAMKSG